MAGQSQSLTCSASTSRSFTIPGFELSEQCASPHPNGILAVTSTFPYLTLTLSRVMSRALCTGLMMDPVLELDTTAHWDTLVEVQVPSAVRLRV
jgi:hypothetical protein